MIKMVTEIGYRLLPKHWRKGYASEIITSLSHYAKVTIGLNKLHAMTYPENVASCNLLRKMNFKFINKTEVYVPIPQKYILANLYCKDL